jgi:hypothetical protein
VKEAAVMLVLKRITAACSPVAMVLLSRNRPLRAISSNRRFNGIPLVYYGLLLFTGHGVMMDKPRGVAFSKRRPTKAWSRRRAIMAAS